MPNEWTGANILALRERLGLTQYEFGVKIYEAMGRKGGKESSSVSGWENEIYEPNAKGILALEIIKAEAEQAGEEEAAT